MPKKIDANQPDIVAALRKAGASVQHLHTLGKGCFDLLVGFRQRNFVIEIKNPAQPPSKRRLTPDEQVWAEGWQGQKAVISTIDEALMLIGAVRDNERLTWVKNYRNDNGCTLREAADAYDSRVP